MERSRVAIEQETQDRNEETAPALFWWLIADGVAALVIHGLLQHNYGATGPSGGIPLVAITVIGGAAGPLLVAGLVGVVLHELGFRRQR